MRVSFYWNESAAFVILNMSYIRFTQLSRVLVWLGFVVPTLAASAMWTMEQGRDKLLRFGVQAGYNLVLFVIFGYVLGLWA